MVDGLRSNSCLQSEENRKQIDSSPLTGSPSEVYTTCFEAFGPAPEMFHQRLSSAKLGVSKLFVEMQIDAARFDSTLQNVLMEKP